MADRSWFYASQGQQQGPCSEAELRDLLARGTVTPDTLVWSEGMAGWQKAGDIPGLGSGASAPPAIPSSGGPPLPVAPGASQPLSIEFGIWDFVWRSLVLLIGLLFIIPTPWVVVMYCRWLVSCVHVPGRPNLAFTGRATTLLWYFAGIVAVVAVAVILAGLGVPQTAFNVVSGLFQLLLYWLLIRWVVANISSDGQPLGLKFSGSFAAYIGWNILTFLSVLTIIGWAWVYTAQLRWLARNIQGARREVVFNGSGLEFLWRAIVTALAYVFIIPIPWVTRWFMRWQASQFALVPRTTV
jgi:hypothetical protein